MEIFKLISTFRIEENGSVNVCLKPENSLINEYIATFRSYDNIIDAQNELNTYIEEMTPLLYNDFKAMENISLELRNKFTL